MPKITIIGSGYVGLVTGTCIADFGLHVVCMDNNEEKINNLKKGEIPIYEPGLDELVKRNLEGGRLIFTTEMKYAVEQADVIFIAVGTPAKEDGNADLRYVTAVAAEIARYINGYKIIVNKSTVPVGTGEKVREIIASTLNELGKQYEFDVVSNPEFLREGNAIYDFTHPDKIVIGTDSERAIDLMKKVYRVLYLNETPFIVTEIATAEMIKYVNNAFLALKISFINEIANLCEKVGANVQQVANAVGKDGRINPKFLHPGPGYGGSCFPKDTMALARIGQDYGVTMEITEAVINVNKKQRNIMVEKIETAMGKVENKNLAILGLTFKPKTDDVRYAPSIDIIRILNEKGAHFRIFDPQGMKEAEKELRGIKDIVYCKDEYEAAEGCDAIILVTEWHQFRNLDLERIKGKLKQTYFFDLRNIYDKKEMQKLGFHYNGVGV